MNPYEGIIAPEGAPPPGEPITPPAATTPSIEDPGMVTLPGAAPQAEKTWEIKADGQVHQMTEAELIEHAQKGIDYTRKMMDLGPAREMREFLERTPGAADALVYLVQNGVPPQAAMQQVQQQSQQQQPEPQMDPAVSFLMEKVGGLTYELEKRDFQSRFPDAKVEEVAQFAYEQNYPSLEAAYKVMKFDEVSRQAALSQQTTLTQRQGTAVEPGAQGPPQQIRVNPKELTPEQITQIGLQHYNLME